MPIAPVSRSQAPTATADPPPEAHGEHRHRLLEGMARAVADKGYADTTIADIVREASVSRRTFYEHFAAKSDCLIALYEAASRNALQVLRSAIAVDQPWQGQVESALAAYLGYVSQDPVLMRTLFIEILHLGAAGLAARRRVNTEIADFLLGTVNASRPGDAARMSPGLAMAVVGGINELVLQSIEDGRADDLRALVEPASQLVRSVAGH